MAEEADDLSPDQARALASVLDEIIPPSDERNLPGAGALGLVAYIEQIMRKSPDLRPAIEQGLSALAGLAGSRGEEFPALPRQHKLEILNELATAQPAFLPGLVFHTYTGYYQNARVLEALGMEGRPPHPKGYEMNPTDPSLFERVRRRSKLYREC